HFTYKQIGDLLYLLLELFHIILAQVLFFLGLLHLIDYVPSYIPDSDFPLFSPFPHHFNKLLPSFLCKHRDIKPYDFTVITRRNPEIRLEYRLFYFGNKLLLPWLDRYLSAVGHPKRGDLSDGGLSTVIIN